MTNKEAERTLAATTLADIALTMGVHIDELGRQYVEFAEAVGQLVHTPKKDDREAIGRLVQAAVNLP